MVGVAQLVELRIVIPAVEGSSPFVHPSFQIASFLVPPNMLRGTAMAIAEEGHAGFN